MRAYLILFLFCLSACHSSNSSNSTPTSSETVATDPQPTTPPPANRNPDLGICSRLNLEDVTWPAELSTAEWTYYAIALNITGSYEGLEGWKNITGNFDGQGLSLGLIQQNLGQGTLQPWLITMYRKYTNTMVTYFNSQDYINLKSMLETWQGQSLLASISTEGSRPLFPDSLASNPLEKDYKPIDQQDLKNTQSVQWAKQNILDGKGNVQDRWRQSFQNMALSSGGRSYQLEASTARFLLAKEYFQTFNFRELRFLLFLFDVVVQNGGFSSTHQAQYESWLKKNPTADEQTRALALLEARLTTVNPKYVEDVRSRKQAIIYGTGVVHKAPRNLPEEFCFDPRVIVQ